jgi:hypothetical protein
MPKSRRYDVPPPVQRGRGRDRHGRGIRSSATGPYLPPLRTRIDFFDMTISTTVEYLRGLWPDELGSVSFEVAAAPSGAGPAGQLWSVSLPVQSVVFFRGT